MSSSSIDTDISETPSVASRPVSTKRSTKSVRWLEDKFSNLTEKFTSKPLAPAPAHFPLNLGIYFEEGQVSIGTTASGSKQLEKIRSFPSVISFSDDKIYVGKIKPGKVHFKLDTLLKDNSQQKHPFMIVTTSFNLSVEEILAFYFEKVLSKVKATRNVDRIGDIVISVPFTLTCLERERLKQAFIIAGYTQVQIFSSVVPIALWYLLQENSIFTDTIHSKLILVVHSLKHSFSMAVLQASFNSIVVKSCMVSENLKDFQDMQFYVGHAQMFSSEGKHQEIVWMAYKATIEQLLNDIAGKPINKIIGLTKPKNEKKLSQILTRFFSENALTMITGDEPLAGASIYASKASMTSSLLPPDIHVLEAFRSNLVFSYGKAEKFAPRVKNRSFMPGKVASLEVQVPQQEVTITLQEEFAQGQKLFPVSQHRIIARGDNPENLKNPIVMVKCYIETDQDGILTIRPNFPDNLSDRLFVRVNELAKKSSVEYGRLKAYYEKKASSSARESPEVVRELRNDAVLFYSVSMKTFDPKGKSPQEILAEHERLKKEAQEKFAKDCESKGVDSKSGMKGLESKLENIFQDIKSFLSNSKGKVKDWFGRKSPSKGSSAEANATPVDFSTNVTVKSSSSC